LDLVKRLTIVLCIGALTGCGDLVGVDFGAAHLTTGSLDATAGFTDGSPTKETDGSHEDHDASKDAGKDTGKDSGTPGKCVAKTCDGLGDKCGAQDDGCGGVLQCGTCDHDQPCVKGQCQCQPTTCPALGATCGDQDNGCGQSINCGTCLASQTCTNNTCACKPTTCAAANASCGDLSDGCGNTLDCGTCASVADPVCGGSGANQCGPTPCTPTTCMAAGKSCGSISDGCGNQITCGDDGGTCAAPDTCGGSGVENVCGCTPTTCATKGAGCGSIPDGCGGTLSCGTCTAPESCDGAGVANACGCTPTTCAALDDPCGAPSNGCGGTLTCKTCVAGQVCYESACCTPRACTVECAGTLPNGCGGESICPPCTCFGAGTDITMADHSHRAIETVHVGDHVLSYDAAGSAWVSATVTRTPMHGAEEGTGVFIVVNGGLRLTSNHPVWIDGYAKSAEHLAVGDTLVVLSAEGIPTKTTVRTLDRVASREVTFDLDVDGPGTFVAGNVVVMDKEEP
jgi:hypothetical protein